MPTNVIKGFRVTGICPFDPEIFTDVEYQPSVVTDRPCPSQAAETPENNVSDRPCPQTNIPCLEADRPCPEPGQSSDNSSSPPCATQSSPETQRPAASASTQNPGSSQAVNQPTSMARYLKTTGKGSILECEEMAIVSFIHFNEA